MKRGVWFVATVSFVLVQGCGGGGGGGSGAAPPPVVTLSTNASEVSAGGQATLTWSATNASSCTASSGWIGTKSTSGTETLGPITAATTYTLTCAPSGGSPSDVKSVTVTPVLIRSDYAKVRPLDTIELNINAPGTVTATATPSFTVQMDVSGAGTFHAANLVEIPALYGANTLTFAAPILEAFQSLTPTSTFKLRVKREADGLLSNALEFRYAPIVISDADRGKPRAVLEGLNRYALMAKPATFAIGTARRPGVASDAMVAIGSSTDIIDIEAEAILRQVYGVATLTAQPTANAQHKVTTAGLFDDDDKELRPLSSLLPERLRNAANDFGNCIGRNVEEFGSFERSSIVCDFNDAAQIVKEDIIGGISDAVNRFSNIAGVLRGMLSPRLTQGFVGRELDHLVEAGARTQTAADTAEIVLSIPGVTATDAQARDWAQGKITDFGKAKLYEYITRKVGLSETDQQILEAVGSQEAFNQALTVMGSQAQRVYNALIDMGMSASEALKEMQSNPEVYGGEALPQEPVSEIPFFGGALPVGENQQSPAAVCAAYPELTQSALAIGFASCEDFITPFFDPNFFRDVIKPLMDSWDFDALLACASTPDTPQCEALLDEFSRQIDEFFETLKGYASEDFKCESSYAQYEASSGARTCIFKPLAYVPPGNCFAGSRPSPWDVNNQNVCVYWSRDLIQTGGTCRPNYKLVPFLGMNRCRWATLPLNKPAAYSLNVETGEKQPLEQ